MMQGRAICALWLSLAAAGGLWAQNDATGHDSECPAAARAKEKNVEGNHGCACVSLQVEMNRIFRTNRSAFDEAGEFVLETNEAWCAFWDKAHAGLQSKPPCRDLGVDFSRETVVAVTLGEHNSCYGVQIDHIDRTAEDGVYVVAMNELERSTDCRCAETLAHPVDAVKIEGTVTEVLVERFVKPVLCNWGNQNTPPRRFRGRRRPPVDKSL
jgi:hypothetical protein